MTMMEIAECWLIAWLARVYGYMCIYTHMIYIYICVYANIELSTYSRFSSDVSCHYHNHRHANNIGLPSYDRWQYHESIGPPDVSWNIMNTSTIRNPNRPMTKIYELPLSPSRCLGSKPCESGIFESVSGIWRPLAWVRSFNRSLPPPLDWLTFINHY